MKDDLEFGILSPLSLARPADGELVLRTIEALLPAALPERYENWEPIRRPYVGIEEALQGWQNPFLWKRSRPRVRGSVWFGKGKRHSGLLLTLESSGFTPDAVVALLRQLCGGLEADLGYLHVFSAEELADSTRYERVMPFRRGLTTNDLLAGLPDLPAVIVLGEPYVKMLGRNNLLQAPVARREWLPSEKVLLQVDDHTYGSAMNFSRFDALRESVKAQLGRHAFGTESQRAALVPHFEFRAEPAAIREAGPN